MARIQTIGRDRRLLMTIQLKRKSEPTVTRSTGRRLCIIAAGISTVARQMIQNSDRNRGRRCLGRNDGSLSAPEALLRRTSLAMGMRQLPQGSIILNHLRVHLRHFEERCLSSSKSAYEPLDVLFP